LSRGDVPGEAKAKEEKACARKPIKPFTGMGHAWHHRGDPCQAPDGKPNLDFCRSPRVTLFLTSASHNLDL